MVPNVSVIVAPVPGVSRAKGWRKADSAAVVVAAIGVVLFAVIGRVAFLRGDDWVILALVADPGFSILDTFRLYGSHLMPLGQSAFWVSRSVFGAAPWWPLVMFGLGFVAAAGCFTWATIRLLVGPRIAAVVPFAVAAWGPAALAAVMWPSPGVYMTPLYAATAAAVYVYVRGRLGFGPRRWTWLVVAVVVAGLFALETALLIGPLLFVVEAAWFTRGGPVQSVRRAWEAQRSLWLGLMALTAVYLALYFLLSSYSQVIPEDRAGVDLLIEGLIVVAWKILPAMVVGAPWMWDAAVAPRNAAGPWMSILVALVAWFIIVRGRRAGWRAWLPLFAMLVLTVGALSAARLATFGTLVLLNPYYYLASLGLLAVALAVGYLPSRLAEPADDSAPRTVPLVVLAVALLTSVTMAAVGYARAVPQLPAREYLDQAATSLQQPTLNTSSPRSVFGVFAYSAPFDTAENTLAFAGVEGVWLRASDEPFMLDQDGLRVPATVEGVDVDLAAGCQPVDGARSFALPETRDPNWPTFVMTYRSDSDQTAVVDLGGDLVELPLRAGAHTVYFTGPAVAPGLLLRGQGLCVDSMTVGAAVPAG